MTTLTKESLPIHACTLSLTSECVTCEGYFWGNLASHDDDYSGLELFLERRVEALQNHE